MGHQQWNKVGELSGLSVFESSDGSLAIERDFEILCELTDEELMVWKVKQAKRSQVKTQVNENQRV